MVPQILLPQTRKIIVCETTIAQPLGKPEKYRHCVFVINNGTKVFPLTGDYIKFHSRITFARNAGQITLTSIAGFTATTLSTKCILDEVIRKPAAYNTVQELKH